MKTTDLFKQEIKSYLDKRAAEDSLFAVSYSKEGKNIDDCCTYILNMVQKSGCNGFADDEIYSMAVHYYDEDNIDVGKPISCNVVVNHTIELTDEEKEEARKKAIELYQQQEIKKMQDKAKKPKVEKVENAMPSLFEF